jgi:acyl CoA:acetate/3-ketoacid CoA transferase alpha subunit
MEGIMKSYTETERQEHLENWKQGTLSKAAYAQSAGILPTTFYTWTRGTTENEKQGFVEINKQAFVGNNQNIVIEKGTITVRMPMTTGMKELQTVLGALESTP